MLPTVPRPSLVAVLLPCWLRQELTGRDLLISAATVGFMKQLELICLFNLLGVFGLRVDGVEVQGLRCKALREGVSFQM